MKIIAYSDLHLEFGTDFTAPRDSGADVMILAGDICTFGDMEPLGRFLDGWTKPVLYIAGNHEYYKAGPMTAARQAAVQWLAETMPNVRFLYDEHVELADGVGPVQFFGGTMWTDFNNLDNVAMASARFMMNDYRLIMNADGSAFDPRDSVRLHAEFMEKIGVWLTNGIQGRRVVITHHLPLMDPKSKYKNSPLTASYISRDAYRIIEEWQPDVYLFGHSHECFYRRIGNTHVLSNQRGYPQKGHLCEGFDPDGAALII